MDEPQFARAPGKGTPYKPGLGPTVGSTTPVPAQASAKAMTLSLQQPQNAYFELRGNHVTWTVTLATCWGPAK